MSDCKSPNAFPPIPKTISVDIEVTQTINAPVYLPFYYGSISSFWIYFEVDLNVLKPCLDNTGLNPAEFDKKSLVNLNFQNYTAHNGNSLAATNELEFNVVAYPDARKDEIPHFSASCYLNGEDQTKILGNYRIHVPCDNKFAVAAGRALYGENKFVATFNYTVPSLNLPTAKTWQYKISDNSNKNIVSVNADFLDVGSVAANPSTIINYSMLNSRLVGSRRNLWATVQNYNLSTKEAKQIKVAIGDSTLHNMAADMASILGRDKDGNAKAKAVAIQVIQTPPVIAESRAYYAGY